MGDIANGTGAQVRAAINAEFNTLRKDASATTPAVAGWYRIASSALHIGRNRAIIELDWTGTGIRGSAEFVATCHEGSASSVKIQELSYSVYDAAHPGLTKARIVYHTTPTGNYAYVEVYLAEATATTINVRLGNPVGWAAVAPSTVGSVPAGYASLEYTFLGGLVAASGPAASAGFFYFANDAPGSGIPITRSHNDIDTGAFLSVGPTGSGAAVIWSTLDAAPAGARGVRLFVLAGAIHGAGAAATHKITCIFRKKGSAAIPNITAQAWAYLTNETDYTQSFIDVQLDANRMFEFNWEKVAVAGGQLTMSIYLIGWYV